MTRKVETSLDFFSPIIYIYIFTNLISTSIHGTRKKQKKTGQEQEIKVSRITAQGKKKKNLGVKKKEKANLVRLLEKNQGVRSQWSKENQKALRGFFFYIYKFVRVFCKKIVCC